VNGPVESGTDIKQREERCRWQYLPAKLPATAAKGKRKSENQPGSGRGTNFYPREPAFVLPRLAVQ
jgi:hypothetical protein